MDKSDRILVYLAGPLFTQGEWQWNAHFAAELRARSLELIVPQERAEPMLQGIEKFDANLLFRENLASIDRAKVVVAILDGADADSGTAWECGYAYKSGKPIIGVRTDIRAGGDDSSAALNLMLSVSCAVLVKVPFAKRTDVAWVADQVHAGVVSAVSPHAILPAGSKSPNS